MADLVTVKRALISVSDKTNIIEFARKLADYGVEIISTGGTAKAIADAGIDVIPIDQVTGFPEMMDGRVKTLHPLIHGGLLALRDNDKHVASMNEHNIQAIDLVCVNLYPFEQTVAREGVTDAEAIEQIDIGGPSMVRSAAKNHRFVSIVTDPSQYDSVVAELDANNGATTLATRSRLCAAAFARTAEYDTAIAQWLSKREGTAAADGFADSIVLRLNKASQLRYGENPHQNGALFLDPKATEKSVGTAKQLHGKELSFNNLYDANGALELVKEIDGSKLAAAAVIKHANPCGFATAATLDDAFDKAYAGDPLAAFGGIVAMNQTVDLLTAQKIVEGQKFLEVIVAPDYVDEALELIRDRWKNVRILATGDLPAPGDRDPKEYEYKRITAGLLVQQRDLAAFDTDAWEHKAGPTPDAKLLEQAVTAMVAVKHLKSNAVCLVNDGALVGAGAGQMDRLASCRIAIEKAADRAKGAIAGSDAFFPFADGPTQLINAGVKAIVQPGGSKRDEETVEACEKAGVTLIFTGRRHFRH